MTSRVNTIHQKIQPTPNDDVQPTVNLDAATESVSVQPAALDCNAPDAPTNVVKKDEEEDNDATTNFVVSSIVEPEFIGPYLIESTLGQGAMGKVFLATHTQLKRRVAIKTMQSDFASNANRVARFKREMEAVGRLDHPNVVRATDAGDQNGLHFIAMEYVDGVDVQDILDHVGALPLALACEIAKQTAIGLIHIQEHGLVHRDLKPSNLIVSRDGQVKILDLGIARIKNDDHVGTLTAEGGLMGTPDFIAPEQILESGCVDIRADIYSLGCTMYRMLAGRAPFEGPNFGTHAAKVIAHTQAEPESIHSFAPSTPPQLVEVIQQMMAKAPQDRIQSPQQIVEAMNFWADDSELSRVANSTIHKEPLKLVQTTSPPVAARKSPTLAGPSSQAVSSKHLKTIGAIVAVLLCGFSVYRLLPQASSKAKPAQTPDAIAATAEQVDSENIGSPYQTAAVAVVRNASPSSNTSLEKIATTTTSLENTANGLAGSVENIDKSTQQIAETLDQIRDSFVAISNSRTTFDNPQSVGELYFNARTYSTQGKNAQARDAYDSLLSQNVQFIDVHKHFQSLLIAQEGLPRARDFYAGIATTKHPVTALAKILLLDKAEKRDQLVELIRQRPDFGPAIYELSNGLARSGSDNQTISERTWEKQLLSQYLKLHEQGHVLRHYLDKTEAAAQIEQARTRLGQLKSQNVLSQPVRATFRLSAGGWIGHLAIPEPCTKIEYSTDGVNFRSTGESISIVPQTGLPAPQATFQMPSNTKADEIFVKYDDLRGVEKGPYKIAFNRSQEKAQGAKRTLERTRFKWLRFKDNRLYFTLLYSYRNAIQQVRYGLNVVEPNRIHSWDDGHGSLFLQVSTEVKYVTVQLTYADGTVSEIVRIDR